MNLIRRFAIAIAIAGTLLGMGILPVEGLVTREGAKNTPYFAIKYEKNQESVVIKALPIERLSNSLIISPQKDNVPLKEIRLYDTQLPYVSYAIKKPKDLESYIDRQIKQAAQKKKIDLKKITAVQMAQLAFSITGQNIKYDYTMVGGTTGYDRAHDDYISELPLDTLIMQEHKGVCRQFAAAYEYIAKRIIITSKSPALKNVKVDEVISYDYNHAYNVIYNVGYNKNQGTVVEMAFIDPTTQTGVAMASALDGQHDALFSELIKSGRYHFSDTDEEATLYALADFAQQGDLSRAQAYAELMSHYNKKIIVALNEKSDSYRTLLAVAGSIREVATVQVTSANRSAQSIIMERYQQNRALMDELSTFAESQSINQ